VLYYKPASSGNTELAGKCKKDFRYKISSELLNSRRAVVYLENTLLFNNLESRNTFGKCVLKIPKCVI
jgi:hypothetical protein